MRIGERCLGCSSSGIEQLFALKDDGFDLHGFVFAATFQGGCKGLRRLRRVGERRFAVFTCLGVGNRKVEYLPTGLAPGWEQKGGEPSGRS